MNVYLNRCFGTGEALRDARCVLSHDSLFLEISHPRECVFERKVCAVVVMVEPELLILQLRLRVMQITIRATFDSELETGFEEHFRFPTKGTICIART